MANYLQGRYKVKNPKKYKGDVNNIIFRSSWEMRMFLFLDSSPVIVEWSSEEIVIPYISVDGKYHRYFPDLKFTTKTGKTFLCEIKPKKETKAPSKRSKNYLNESYTFVKNKLKWEAAEKYCLKNKMNFYILTEDHIHPTFSDTKIMEKLSPLLS